MDILKTIQEEREEFNALPTSEKIKRNRERRVASLLNVGYITPDEAKTYREQLTELPQDRKGLVVAYFLLGIESHLDTIPSTEETKRIEEIIGSFHLSERGALRNGKTIADTLTPEEQSRWSSELSQAHTEEQIRKAETFVDAKRNRIRGQLLKFIPYFIASSLLEDEQGEESELDAIPYLREQLQERGYRAKAKSLNDADKAAIQGAASHYLDLIELAFLSGVGLIRYEEYRGYLSEDGERWEKDFLYRDALDEALTEFETIYILLDNAIARHYTDGTPKDAIEEMKFIFRKMLEESSSFVTLQGIEGSKFNYLIEEANI